MSLMGEFWGGGGGSAREAYLVCSQSVLEMTVPILGAALGRAGLTEAPEEDERGPWETQ